MPLCLSAEITPRDFLATIVSVAIGGNVVPQYSALDHFKKGFTQLYASSVPYSAYIAGGSCVFITAATVLYWQKSGYNKRFKQVRQEVAAVHQDVAIARKEIGAVDEHLQEGFLKTQELVLATQLALEKRLEELEVAWRAILSDEGELTREKIAQLYDESGKIRAQLSAISSEQEENQRALLETFAQEGDLTRESIVQLQDESAQMRTQLNDIRSAQEQNQSALQTSLNALGLTLRTEMQQTGSAQTTALLDFEERTNGYLENEFRKVHERQDVVIQLLTQQQGSHTRTLPTTCASSSMQLTQR
jgi:hypothetical protein